MDSSPTKLEFELELIEQLIGNSLYDEALGFLNKLLQEHDNGTIHFLKGKTLFLTGKFEEAISSLSTTLTKDGSNWKAYETLGEVHRCMNSDESAESFYKKATDLNNQAWNSWLGRGKIAYKKGEFQIAILCFETYLNNYTDNSEVWELLAISYRSSGNLMSAIDAYNTALDYEPTNIEFYEALGDIYAELGYDDIAKKKYLQALQVEEKTRAINSNLYIKTIRVLYDLQEYQKSFSLASELLTLDKENTDALFLSGKALIMLGDVGAGKERIERAYEKEKKDEYWSFLRELDSQLYS